MSWSTTAGVVRSRVRHALASALLILVAIGVAASPAAAGTAEEISVLPTLDNLKRSESSLSNGGKWAPLPGVYVGNSGGTGQVTSTGWGPAATYASGTNGAYWTPRTFSDETGDAAAITMQTSPGGEDRWVSLWLNMPNPAAAKSGYELRWAVEPAGFSGFNVKLVKWVSGAETVLASSKGVAIANGTTMAISDTGGTITAWKGTSSLATLLSASDTTYSSGYTGIEGRGNISRSSDFKAGRLIGGAITKTKVLDDFERYEVPLANGKWTKSQWTTSIGGSWTNNTWHGYGSSSGLAGAYWNGATFNDTKDAVLVGATVGTGSVTSGQYGALWLDAPTPGTARSGYELRFTGTGSATAYKLELSKWAAGTRTLLATKEGVALPVGTTIALSEQSGSLVAWTGTTTFTPLLSAADTTYTSGYVGIDVNGGQGTYYNFRGGSVAPPPPDTTISEGSATGVAAPNFGFAFSGSSGTTGFECSLDAAAFAACTSPKAYSGIAAGSHTFRVRAVGAGGPDETPAQRTVEVVSANAAVNRVPLRDNFERSEIPLASPKWAKFQWAASIGGVWWGTYRGYGSSGGDAGAYLTGNSFNAGEGTVTTSAVVGNESRGAGEFQSIWLNAPNPGSTKQGYEARYEGVSGSGYTVTLNKWVAGSRQILATASNVTLPVGTTLGLTKSGTALTLWSGKAESYSQVLTANDWGTMTGYAGLEVNGGAGTLNNFRAGLVDVTPPDTAITEGPSGEVSDPNQTFAFNSPDATATFECSLDGAAYAVCTSPKAYQALSEGPHAFAVRARDLAGNIDPTPATRSFQIGDVPDTSITEGTYSTTASTSAGFRLAAEFGATFECRLDSGAWQACSTYPRYANLAAGPHHFEARAVEGGIADPTPAQRDWTVDPNGPLVKPKVEGTPRIGRMLTVTKGTWGGTQPTSYSYQWYRCPSSNPAKFGSCQAISGATGSNYLLTQADQGQNLVAQVTANRIGGAAGFSAQSSSESGTTTLSRFSLPALIEVIRSALSERLVFYGCEKSSDPNPSIHPCGLWLSNGAGATPVSVQRVKVDDERELLDEYHLPALSRDGSLIAYIDTLTNCIMVIPAQASSSPRVVTCPDSEAPEALREPDFTPDGRIVYVDRYDHRVWRINVDGSGKEPLFSWPNSPDITGPIVSPDGTHLAFSSNRSPSGEAVNGVWVTTMSGTEPRFIQSQRSELDWSPDGSKLVLTFSEAGTPGSFVGIYNLLTSTRTKLGPPRVGSPTWSADGQLIAGARLTEGQIEMVIINASTGSEQVILGDWMGEWGILHPSFRFAADPEAVVPDDLLERYKPVVFYHPEETYFAETVEGAVEWPENLVYEALPEYPLADNDPSTGYTDLSQQWLGERPYSELNVLDLKGDNQTAANWGHGRSGNHVYGNAVPSADGKVIWLQYWFFYYYNDSINAGGTNFGTHEGDWEFVQYAYDVDSEQITKAVYNQHDGAEVGLPNDLHYVLTADGRTAPAVYSAKSSHASYFHPGDYNLELGPLHNLGNDHVSDEAGPTELTMSRLTDEPWFDWEGHWGGTFEGEYTSFVDSSSPTGPGHGANETEIVDPDRVAGG
ncbi:MAG TPA: Vps62-related protein [Solirubrobacterales bacterium]|nr:Vps62-related protein [Solirubrobacterales bacterium]